MAAIRWEVGGKESGRGGSIVQAGKNTLTFQAGEKLPSPSSTGKV